MPVRALPGCGVNVLNPPPILSLAQLLSAGGAQSPPTMERTLAAIMAGLHVSKQTLSDLKMVVFGAGTAGIGIADQVRDAIAEEKGVSKEEAAKQIWLVNLANHLIFSIPSLARIMVELTWRPRPLG